MTPIAKLLLAVSSVPIVAIASLAGAFRIYQAYDQYCFDQIERAAIELGGSAVLWASEPVVFVNLAGPKIDDDTLRKLRPLCLQFTNLRLHLRDTSVTPEGMTEFCSNQPHWRTQAEITPRQ